MLLALVQDYAEQLPFSDGCVDFVTMGFTLRYVSNLESIFLEDALEIALAISMKYDFQIRSDQTIMKIPGSSPPYRH